MCWLVASVSGWPLPSDFSCPASAQRKTLTLRRTSPVSRTNCHTTDSDERIWVVLAQGVLSGVEYSPVLLHCLVVLSLPPEHVCHTIDSGERIWVVFALGLLFPGECSPKPLQCLIVLPLIEEHICHLMDRMESIWVVLARYLSSLASIHR